MAFWIFLTSYILASEGNYQGPDHCPGFKKAQITAAGTGYEFRERATWESLMAVITQFGVYKNANRFGCVGVMCGIYRFSGELSVSKTSNKMI